MSTYTIYEVKESNPEVHDFDRTIDVYLTQEEAEAAVAALGDYTTGDTFYYVTSYETSDDQNYN